MAFRKPSWVSGFNVTLTLAIWLSGVESWWIFQNLTMMTMILTFRVCEHSGFWLAFIYIISLSLLQLPGFSKQKNTVSNTKRNVFKCLPAKAWKFKWGDESLSLTVIYGRVRGESQESHQRESKIFRDLYLQMIQTGHV